MTDDGIKATGLLIGLLILIAGGGALFMLWLAWVYQSFALLAPLGYWESTIGFALTALITTALFGAGGRS